jgi:hypothetical protein
MNFAESNTNPVAAWSFFPLWRSRHPIVVRLLAHLAAALLISGFAAYAQESATVNGQNATVVYFGAKGGAQGAFRQVADKSWVETGPDGARRHALTETGRDEWSIYLNDDSRDLSVQLDLYTKEVKFSQGNNKGVLAQVLKSEAAPVRTEDRPRRRKDREEAAIPAGPKQVEPRRPASPNAADKKVFTVVVPDMVESDKLAVMNWIKVQATGAKLPFCWRQSYGRGAGEVLSACRNGTEKDGLLCYTKCPDGYGAAGPVCWARCPAGFTEIGAFCQKPAPYGRGAGYPWKFGDGLNLNGAMARCVRDNPQGCEQSGQIIYPKCNPGFHPVGCCLCSPDCPPGWTDTGTGCTKPTQTRGAGEPMICREGLEQDGALCYPRCKPGFHGVGPVCWQDTPPGWVNCGAACAKTSADCAQDVSDQVLSTLTVAANIATLGLAAPETAAAGAAEKTVTIAGKAMTGGSRIGKAFVKAVKVMQTVRPEEVAKDATLIRRLGDKAGKVKDTIEVSSTLYQAGSDFSTVFADDFANQTSAEIDREINNRFRPEVARYLKEQWGMVQLHQMSSANGFVVAQDTMAIVSLVDITGITGMVGSFVKPVCQTATPFPALQRSYR